jgi:hypothetical protein
MAARKHRQIDPTRYPLDNKMTMPQRMASCLNWCAEEYPYEVVSWRLLYQAVMGMAVLPSSRNAEVENLKSRSQAVKKLLHEQYGRGLVILPGLGVRASVDDFDRGLHCVFRATKRAASAVAGAKREIEAVDIRKIPETKETKGYRDWHRQNATPLLSSANELLKRALLLTSKKVGSKEEEST